MNNIEYDLIIDSFWEFINNHKLDYVNLEHPFIKYKNGKLIFDIDDLNACNINNESYPFLEILNHLKNQIQEK